MSKSKQSTILVVEDDPTLLEFLVDTLKAQDFLVLAAASGNQAWQMIQTSAIDLLVTDSAMPDGNGFQLIRQIEQSGRAMPVLVLSGYLSLDEKSAKKRGATAYLRKPATPSELVSAVKSLIGSHAA
ncbi:MAG: response regulator [Bdellovibrionales bacterium]|nr:response regulator [Bdellovibrionales bacterium]